MVVNFTKDVIIRLVYISYQNNGNSEIWKSNSGSYTIFVQEVCKLLSSEIIFHEGSSERLPKNFHNYS